MVEGYCRVKVECYSETKRGIRIGTIRETGFSSVKELNNEYQYETAYREAISNARVKYSYHTKQRYDSTYEIYTRVIEYDFIYTQETRKGKIKRIKNNKTGTYRQVRVSTERIDRKTRRDIISDIKNDRKQLTEDKAISRRQQRYETSYQKGKGKEAFKE